MIVFSRQFPRTFPMKPPALAKNGMTGGEIPGFCSKTAAETGNECFLLRTGSEGLDLKCIERAEASEQLILSGKTMVDSAAELVDIPLQGFDGGQVLELRG